MINGFLHLKDITVLNLCPITLRYIKKSPLAAILCPCVCACSQLVCRRPLVCQPWCPTGPHWAPFLLQQDERNYHEPEKLAKLQARVHVGGKQFLRMLFREASLEARYLCDHFKGTACRKKVAHRTPTADDKKQLQFSLKKLGINIIFGIEEVNMFTNQGTVITRTTLRCGRLWQRTLSLVQAMLRQSR